jgi:DMSO/TMAO reductase YedYZ heme-binding membrane subunit
MYCDFIYLKYTKKGVFILQIIISLIIVFVFTLIFNKYIKINSKLFYIISIILGGLCTTISLIEMYFVRLNINIDFLNSLIDSIVEGYIPTAFFIIVMIIGAMNTKWKITRKFLCIRAEIAIIASILIFPLFITSFKLIRKKITGSKWKRLQRWSYLFYFLTYIHIAAVVIEKNILYFILYTTIFGSYTMLRINKYYSIKKRKAKAFILVE